MTQVVNLAKFSNSLDSSGGLSTSALNAVFPINKGGTNATTDSGARTNLGLGTIAVQNSSNVDITGGVISDITDLSIADGGTGASTAEDARANLGLTINSDVFEYISPDIEGGILRSDGSMWQAEALNTYVGLSLGAGTVAPGSFFDAVTGATGKVLVKLHVHSYATYGNWGRNIFSLVDYYNYVSNTGALYIMEWEGRVSGDGRTVSYLLGNGTAYKAYSFQFNYGGSYRGVFENAYYSFIGS